MLSTNKQVVEGRLVGWEYEQFRVHEGRVIMQPYPKGEKSPVFFTLTELDVAARKAVFENPEHDFPQIITYHRSWNYFTNRFGIRIAAELEPKPGIPPSAPHLASVMGTA